MITRYALGYLRVSSAGQTDGDGFVRQRVAINAYARVNDIRVVRFYEETASGGQETYRPAWRALVKELLAGRWRAHGPTAVIVERLDRFARDLMVQENMLRDLRAAGFELLSTAEPDLCGEDPTRKLIRQIMGSVAEYDKSLLVIKLRIARQRRRERGGRCEGRKAFGAREGEQETLERMRRLWSRHHQYKLIADQLNAASVPTRVPGKRWHPASVRRILRRSARHATLADRMMEKSDARA